jgi:hypothetical protein
MGFTKLHATIIHSSIWQESAETRVVWVTMLAMADADGIVRASVGGLAHASNVSRQDCEKALESFLGPDPDSSDGTTGERIEAVPGGWLVLNHANYRDKQTRQQELTAARVRKHRSKTIVTRNNVTPGNAVPPLSSPHLPTSPSEADAGRRKEGRKGCAPKDVTAHEPEVGRISDYLKSIKVLGLAPAKRAALARELQSCTIGVDRLRGMWDRIFPQYKTKREAAAFFCKLLQDNDRRVSLIYDA